MTPTWAVPGLIVFTDEGSLLQCDMYLCVVLEALHGKKHFSDPGGLAYHLSCKLVVITSIFSPNVLIFKSWIGPKTFYACQS